MAKPCDMLHLPVSLREVAEHDEDIRILGEFVANPAAIEALVRLVESRDAGRIEACEWQARASGDLFALHRTEDRTRALEADLSAALNGQADIADMAEAALEREATLAEMVRRLNDACDAYSLGKLPWLEVQNTQREADHVLERCPAVTEPFGCRLSPGHEGRHVPVDVRESPVDVRTLAGRLKKHESAILHAAERRVRVTEEGGAFIASIERDPGAPLKGEALDAARLKQHLDACQGSWDRAEALSALDGEIRARRAQDMP